MSSDGGTVWNQMDSYYDDGGCCIVHPDSSNLILTGGKGPITQTNWSFVVSYSRDNGSTWTRCNLSGDSTGWCHAMAVAPSAANIIYAGGAAAGAPAVYRSTNFGVNWQRTATAPADTVFFLEVDPQDPARVYAATPAGVFLTTNSGATWTNLRGGTDLYAVRQYPGSPDTLVAGGAAGVSISTDRGGTWTQMSSGLEGRAVMSLAFAEHGGTYLIAGTAGGACFGWQFETGITSSSFVPHASALSVLPNPFVSFCRIVGRERDEFAVYDYAGRQLGKAIGEKIGATLAAGVYFLRATGSDEAPVRIVKTR